MSVPLDYGWINSKRKLIIWGYRKLRIKASTIQMPVNKERMAAPNLRLYYHAAQIVAIMQWWLGRNRCCREAEQEFVHFPLSEAVFWPKRGRMKLQTQGNYISKCLFSIWNKYQEVLIPRTFPLMSFIYHPWFHSAALIFFEVGTKWAAPFFSVKSVPRGS